MFIQEIDRRTGIEWLYNHYL